MKFFAALLGVLLVNTARGTSRDRPATPGHATLERRGNCTGPVASKPQKWWRSEIDHNGTAPLAQDRTFQYYRTVVQYGADNTGQNDSSNAFNLAINAWNRTGNTVTTLPAYVYIPPGTYRLKKSIQMLVSTYLIGDPLNLPTLVADPDLGSSPVIEGFDGHQGDGSATKNFYMSVRNINIDTTGINASTHAVGIDWSVSQACSLNNVHVNMLNSSNHTGLTMWNGGSGVTISDCTFTSGAIGVRVSNQQYEMKGLSFDGCSTGIKIDSVFVLTLQDISFSNCQYGVDSSTGFVGTVSLVDSSINSCSAGINVNVSGSAQGSLVLENISVDAGVTTTVRSAGGDTLLSGSVSVNQTWVMGNESPQNYQSGKMYQINPPSALQKDGKYFTMPAPQYENYDLSQIINIKNDSQYPIFGDNVHDDGPNINSFLQKYANCKIIFVPQGIYITYSTIFIPPGTRLVGEMLSIISGNGSTFSNSDGPQPVVKIGNPGDKGVAQISDILIQTSDILPGAKLLEINIAGNNPGDAGLWNSALRVGGSADSLVTSHCSNPDTSSCKAAFALLHITKTASVYVENMWGWVADHSLDGNFTQNIAVGRGALIESTQPTWLVGTSFEHCALYQYNLNNASNVYIGMQQTEIPYWQGSGQPNYAPAPWASNAAYGDPTFANCAAQGLSDNGQCYRAWGHYMSGGSNIVIHGSALWVFYDAMNNNSLSDPECKAYGNICQTNMAYVNSTTPLFWYSLSTKSTTNVVYDDTKGNTATSSDNIGGWGAVIAAYLRDSGIAANEYVLPCQLSPV